MPGSDSGASLVTRCRALTDVHGDERRDRALELLRFVLDDVNRIGEISPECVDHLRPRLDDDDPAVRSVAVGVLGFAAGFGDVFDVDRSRFVPETLERIDDENPLVRQAVVNPVYASDVVEETLADGDFEPKSPTWLAEHMLERLHDPSPTVRKRVAGVLNPNRRALVAAHPDPGRALAALLGALSDPVDGLGGNHGKASTPRTVALDTLRETPALHDPLAANHLDDVTDRLWDDDVRVRWAAIRLLKELVDTSVASLDRVAPPVADAIVDGQYPYGNRGFGFAVSVAIAEPRATDAVTALLLDELTATDARNHWFDLDGLLDALARLVTETDRSFHPAIRTLAAQVADDDVDTGDRDPLLHLAEPHPEFVAEILREGYAALPDSDHGMSSRFDHDLAAEIAARNPRAVDGVLDVMLANVTDKHVRRALRELADEHADAVAPVVPQLFERDVFNPPVHRNLSAILEATVEHLDSIPQPVTDALATTVESTDCRAKSRRHALRALIAAHENALVDLPDRLHPLLEPYHDGAFDETNGDDTDPLDTDALTPPDTD